MKLSVGEEELYSNHCSHDNGFGTLRIGINPEWAVAKQEFIGKEQGQGQWID